MGHFVPHTDAEIQEMLAFVGCESLDDLFSAIPGHVRRRDALAIQPGASEADVLAGLEVLGSTNGHGDELICFAGGGAYDHQLPSAVRSLGSRSEFLTAYTPYQPEVAQGVLQAVFEFQTMIARLAGLPVSNASLYDGATACVEAINMAVAATGRSRILVSSGLNPRWREVLDTHTRGTRHEVATVELHDGLTSTTSIRDDLEPAALLVQYPNYYGCIEDLRAASGWVHSRGGLLIVAFDPVAVGILNTPGSQGADVVVGEGQSFGTPLSFGGPYLGLFACRSDLVRRLPGRLVGETVDNEGRTAYVTTLRTREQDIRREKASSNICTNQTLMAVNAAIHLSWLGTAGLRELALRCARGTKYLRDQLMAIDGVDPYYDAPVLREFAVRTKLPASAVLDRLLDDGYLGGIPLPDDDGVLITVTERRTLEEIDGFVAAFTRAVV